MLSVRTKLVAVLLTTVFVMLSASSASAQTMLVSKMGAKCLDVEGSIGQGRRLIGWACHGGTNQQFLIEGQAGQIRIGGYCLDAKGGQGNDGDEIVLWPCAKNADGFDSYVRHQLWTLQGDRIRGINGKCLVLRGGSSWWNQTQPAILFRCNGTENEFWYQGVLLSASQVSGGRIVQSGAYGSLSPTIISGNSNALIGGDGASLIGGDTNSLRARIAAIVAAGGGNMSARGGNLISDNAGKVIVIVRSGN